MTWFFRRSSASVKPDYTGVQLQTAVASLPIPIVYGRAKIAPNIVFYDNFQTHAQQTSSGKGGGGKTTTGYTYSADVVMALCEGPISSIGTVWKDQTVTTMAAVGLTLFTGTTPQSVWSYAATAYPSRALGYQGTAYACAANYDLGGSASIGNHNYEVIGVLAGTGANGVDADPAQMIYDFLTNAQYGAGFAAGSIDMTTLYGAGGDASLQTWCRAAGIAFSAALSSAEQASSTLTRWLQLANCAAVWSGGKLKFIPYADQSISAGSTARVVTSPVPVPAKKPDGSFTTPAIVVSTTSAWVSDGGVVFSFTGAALTYDGAVAPTASGHYGITPNGTYLFAAADKGKEVTISFTSSVSVAYVPNATPAYALTDLDFLSNGNSDPVQVARLDPFALPTVQRLECLSRSNQYGSVAVEARDQSQIEAFGLRVGSSVQAHEICDEVTIGPVVAQALLQRQLYTRTRYSFKLSWEFCLLDPMDVVSITDANLGLVAYPVRIVAIEEDDHGMLTVTAEELVSGVSTPAANPSSGSAAFQPNQGSAAASINTPLIYEPPPALTNDIAQVWVGASGGSAGVADPNWGGAFVWASVDNTTFSQIGVVTQPLRQGVTTATLANASGWDVTNTLSVNLAQSAGTLSGTSDASAQTGSTLALVDGELVAYAVATLTGANAYNLTRLQRGIAGTLPASHSSSAPFARLDGAVVKYDLPSTWIGVPLWFKFQSFNVFGAGAQDLSTCTAYAYTPSGSGTLGPVTAALQLGTALDFGLASQAVTESDDWGSATPATASVDLGNVTS